MAQRNTAMKFLLAAGLAALCATAAQAQPGDPDTIVYNRMGNEVGVIQSRPDSHTFIVQPTRATLDLGYYEVAMPAQAMRPRPNGGWVTLMTNEQIAFLRPTDDRYFQPSGN
jgi:hypothetical protein